jgi:hypothetical protein
MAIFSFVLALRRSYAKASCPVSRWEVARTITLGIVVDDNEVVVFSPLIFFFTRHLLWNNRIL